MIGILALVDEKVDFGGTYGCTGRGQVIAD